MEKPDFEALVKNISTEEWDYDLAIAGTSPSGRFSCGKADVIELLEHVWNTHVVPLQKTLKEIDAFIDTCNDEYKREYADLELKVRRQSDHIEVLKTENKALREEISQLRANEKSRNSTFNTGDS